MTFFLSNVSQANRPFFIADAFSLPLSILTWPFVCPSPDFIPLVNCDNASKTIIYYNKCSDEKRTPNRKKSQTSGESTNITDYWMIKIILMCNFYNVYAIESENVRVRAMLHGWVVIFSRILYKNFHVNISINFHPELKIAYWFNYVIILNMIN